MASDDYLEVLKRLEADAQSRGLIDAVTFLAALRVSSQSTRETVEQAPRVNRLHYTLD